MQYLLALYVDQSGWGRMTPEQQQQGTAAYTAYTEALRSGGVLINSNRLRPSDHTSHEQGKAAGAGRTVC
jgi:hypothetical protein